MPIFGKSKGLAETARAAADQLSGGPADIKRQLAAGDLPANLREDTSQSSNVIMSNGYLIR